MNIASPRAPRVTIVMTARERHGLAEIAIASIVRHTLQPYRFLYLDVQSPAWLREILAQRAAEWGLEVVRYDEPLWPHEARQRIAADLATDYVVFIDNDVEVYDGWLDALVDCADSTGAGIVGPLYLWSNGAETPRIHMAGGKLIETMVDGGRALDESHQLINADYAQTAPGLQRQVCDFVEFHCMLIRTALLADGGLIDPSIRCVHEHIDTALTTRERGYPVYFEPQAKVNYLAFADYRLDDLDYFRRRWSLAEANASIEVFCRKWNVIDDARSFGGVRGFARDHVRDVDLLRHPLQTDRDVPMRSEELTATRSALLDLATTRGYLEPDLALISEAYHVAHVLVDGGYRPCGRPFINHLAGTAGVLVRYGLRADIVIAALLHAAYSNSPPHAGGPQAAADTIAAWLGGKGSSLEQRVRAYSLRDAQAGKSSSRSTVLADLSLRETEIIVMVAANEVDMHLSGEFRYSGRPDALKPEVLETVVHACGVLGIAGLGASLIAAHNERREVAPSLVTHMHASYRISTDRRSAVPMVGNAVAGLQPEPAPALRSTR